MQIDKNLTNILLHYVLGTQKETPMLIDPHMRKLLFEVVCQIGREYGFEIRCVGGCYDHLHLIIELDKKQKVDYIAHTIQEMTRKYFLNEYSLDLNWKDCFLAFSVGVSEYTSLKQHILDDSNHKNYSDEYIDIARLVLKI